MDDRLTELETKMTYQDHIIESLNELVIEQQKQIDMLILAYQKLNTQATSDDNPTNLVEANLEPPPPHY